MSPFSWDSTTTDSSIDSLEDVRNQSDAGLVNYQSTSTGPSYDQSMTKKMSYKHQERNLMANVSGNQEGHLRLDKRKSILAYQIERRKRYVETDFRVMDNDIPILEEKDDDLSAISPVDMVCSEPKQPSTKSKDQYGTPLESESEVAKGALQLRSIKSGLLYRIKGKGLRIKNSWKLSYTVVSRNAITFYTRENGKVCGQFDLTLCTSTSIEVMPKDSTFDGSNATLWRFAIRSVKDRMVFSAESEADLKEWLRAIHLAIQLKSNSDQRFSDVRVASGTFLASFGRGLFRFSAQNGQ
uniref:Uncharacterized protein AlNc14C203G8749 n=1 Tax=Albugo laibachii Nc14 TaxID=890382 RepID=F0W7X1_9STRA|nr:conserved hypothetical protein [Albugo laibachii Nc14]CCA23699.1 conserved hypothetical protein [Albugo laibachii Nc14]|eukprot:CCA23699.1 conserved hypothetical protein [Albugo laibachii Nc14]